MKFKEYSYERPDIKKAQEETKNLLEDFKTANAEEQIQIVHKYNEIRNYLNSMITLSSIRNSINLEDEFYKKEKDFWNENTPIISEISDSFYRALNDSKYKEELEKEFGHHLFDQIEVNLKTFSPEIIEDLIEENKIISEYDDLIGSAEIEYDGKINNISDMTAYRQSKDRKVRQESSELVFEFFNENLEKFDELYDKLVKVRTKIAKKLGFDTFTELGYLRMGRTDYNAEDVANYRRQVYEHIVPISQDLRKRQQERLGIDDFKYYDRTLSFTSGNAKPHGNDEWIMDNGRKMYEELGEVPHEFFTFMTEHELFDVKARPRKQAGGYCTYIEEYNSPFIFANFNGTAGDVEVLTHEAGHALQVYLSRDYELPEYIWPSMEAAEIHSMSMEFLTWPWMELFFEEETEKFKYSHLEGAVNFIPYGVTIDEFQHFVYENPEATPQERRAKFREIEKKYLPDIDYTGNEYLENGGFFYIQGHLFWQAFYYIDYTLAQVCAFQFLSKAREDADQAMEDYLRLCRQGGSKSFLDLLEVADLENPFEDGTIQKSLVDVQEILESIDDSSL